MKTFQLRYLVLLILISTSSLLAGKYVFGKGNLSLGIISGASVGFELVNEKNPNREYYTNAIYYKRGSLWFAGINHETRYFQNQNWYLLSRIGLDYLETKALFGDLGGGNSDKPQKYSSTLLPHLTAGVGYQYDLNEDLQLYIDWDLGIKASITNLNIGLKFKYEKSP